MARRRRRSSSFERRGEPFLSSTRQARVPPAQERVRRTFYPDAFYRPTSPVGVYFGPRVRDVTSFTAKQKLSRRYGRDAKLTPYAALRQLQMMRPRRVLFCVRRAIRRGVLFALDLAGRPGSGPGRRRPDGRLYRRTEESNYSC